MLVPESLVALAAEPNTNKQIYIQQYRFNRTQSLLKRKLRKRKRINNLSQKSLSNSQKMVKMNKKRQLTQNRKPSKSQRKPRRRNLNSMGPTFQMFYYITSNADPHPYSLTDPKSAQLQTPSLFMNKRVYK
ncbi:Hypothetical_protein [Hexamita inflata]|uniref:Hypothetical_protein n=1 Tax=Hexamita inflata TaxID=28002 RepID=A0AA86TST5_9EUKA|nr:Hypothetical protein HINF_LOCUS15269 [Hexamita inflata]